MGGSTAILLLAPADVTLTRGLSMTVFKRWSEIALEEAFG